MSNNLIPLQRIEHRILLLRGEKVKLDSDLAELYGVETKVLNQAVQRNLERFPGDFMFRLSADEAKLTLRSQIVTSKPGRGGRRYQPYAFTEQGVAMLSSVLTSPRAIQVNLAIMRTFVQLGGCSRRTPIWRANWNRWSANTTSSSVWCSMRSAS